jgi:CheY-like chemotaxis protein
MNILFADDSAVTQSLVQPLLATWGHDVVVVGDGAEAWELWQSTWHRVVLADWSMPRLDGLELCRRIRAHPQGRHTYFILQTARAKAMGEATKAGVSRYLTKPVVPAELLAALREAAEVLGL